MFKVKYLASLSLFAFLLVISACKKNEIIPPPGSSTPVFTAIGSFGSDAIDLRAGDDDVVMTTETSILNGVDFFKGNLGNESFNIEIGVYGGDVDVQNPSVPDFSSLEDISFAHLAQQPPLFVIKKDSLPNSASIIKVEWEVDGVMQTNLDDLEIHEPGKYQICAHVTFTDYSVKSVCNEVIVGFKPNVAFELEFVMGQDHNLMAWIEPSLGIIQSVHWFQDGVAVSDLNQLNQTIQNGNHLIQAEVLFTNGVKQWRSVVVDADLTGKNIFDFYETCSIAPLQWDFKAKLKVVKDGIEYFSHLTPNNTNKIIVSEVKYFGLNSLGKAVYIIKGQIHVNLKSLISPTVVPLDLNVSFGISLK
jgi:hypothetical protein